MSALSGGGSVAGCIVQRGLKGSQVRMCIITGSKCLIPLPCDSHKEQRWKVTLHLSMTRLYFYWTIFHEEITHFLLQHLWL